MVNSKLKDKDSKEDKFYKKITKKFKRIKEKSFLRSNITNSFNTNSEFIPDREDFDFYKNNDF